MRAHYFRNSRITAAIFPSTSAHSKILNKYLKVLALVTERNLWLRDTLERIPTEKFFVDSDFFCIMQLLLELRSLVALVPSREEVGARRTLA